MKLNELTIKQASEGIRKKEFSVTELVSDCLAAAKEKNKELNAYLEIFDDAGLQAKKTDEMLSKMGKSEIQNLPLLYGIPLAVKDNILIGGKRSTAGSKILENYIASYDAAAIGRLKKLGAIFLGKTNLDEFAMGSSTENSAFGPTKNPHDTQRVAGGSSGGSAAAVSANLCLAALGSDTGGSIRQPASFCGVVGLKTTYGAVSRHGLIAMASSLDQIGPIAKNVEDAEIIFNVIGGKDDFDSTSARDTGKSDFPREVGLRDIRMGVPKEYFASGLNPEVEKIIKSVLKKVENAGAKLEEISLPHSEYALAVYYIIVPSEVSANLARFDGIRYGHSHKNTDALFEVYAKTRSEGFGDEVKRRIMLGTYALSAGYYDAYYLKAQKVRRLVRQDFEKAFEKVDFILGPTTPTPAFKIGEKSDNPLQMYLNDVYTVPANLAGIPALSIPAGFTGKLPVGLQIIGKWFEENNLLAVAKLVEELISNS